jgi:hypothetical protein
MANIWQGVVTLAVKSTTTDTATATHEAVANLSDIVTNIINAVHSITGKSSTTSHVFAPIFGSKVTGISRTTSCFNYFSTKFVFYKYAIGSIVYDCRFAQKGIIEAVFIKDVRLINKFGQYIPLYIDTYNGFHNEYDLCDQQTAIALAEEYIETKLIELSKYCNTNNYLCNK